MTTTPMDSTTSTSRNFIKNIIDEDIQAGRITNGIVTRFPPEPNGYLHIGHASAALLNSTIIDDYPGSRFHLRFDDTNPEKEDNIFVEAIKSDLQWLGIQWGEHLYHASDYFERLHEIAKDFIQRGLAYVCDLTPEQVIEYRGTLTSPGKDSPFRDRSPAENLELFAKMTAGDFQPGSCTLRAKIDMTSGNVHMRDPVIYRIRNVTHQRVGDRWKIYPAYDFTHCLSDAIEGITHSLCSIEFQDHRPLYDWFVARADIGHIPHQYEFTRLNVDYTVTSKRKLRQLVEEQHVAGWDDPRMPTVAGMRNRGYPPEAIRAFCKMVGVSRKETIIEFSLLEECVRTELNETAPRAMAVMQPIKVVITNYADDNEVLLSLPKHPKDPTFGNRALTFSKELYIDASDFEENPPKGFFRLSPGKEVRLRGAYVIKCEQVIKDQNGAIKELQCTYDPDTLGRKPEGRKVKGVIHWVGAADSHEVAIHEYDRLFKEAAPSKDEKAGTPFTAYINPDSLIKHTSCRVEPSLGSAQDGDTFQFERLGYFVARATNEGLLFTKVVTLKDSWAKEQKKS